MLRCLKILCLLAGLPVALLGQTFSEPVPLSLNTDAAEFGAAWYRDGLLFSSERNNSDAGVTHIERASGNFLADLYFTKRRDSLKWSRPNRFATALNTNLHEGPVAVGSDSLSLFLVRSLRLPKKNAEQAPIAEILYFETDGKTWQNAQPVQPGPPNATYTDPFLSPDGKWLYFASDMPGGFGGLDLYRVRWPLDGQKAENLGAQVNGRGNERYPFVEANGKLYFSTSGRRGLGGIDIFMAREFKGRWSEAVNLGAPINTEFDDFGLRLSPRGDEGILCSNRKRGGLDDDLYQFAVTRELNMQCSLQQQNSYCYELYEDDTGPLPIPTLFYRWDLGDGTKAKGVAVEHCFPGPGDYKISLSVVDSLTDLPVFQQTQYLLEIRNAEQAYISGPDSIPMGTEAIWDGTASNLPGFEAERYEWDFGDGEKGEGERVSHVYVGAGEYEMRLALYGKAADVPDEISHCVVRSIHVGNVGRPVADSYATVVVANANEAKPVAVADAPPSLRSLPRSYFKVQAGTAPRSMSDVVALDPRMKGLEQVVDGDEVRYVLADSLGFEEGMRKLKEVRQMGFPKPALLVFRSDSLLPHQPFLDHWLPADGVSEVLVKGVVVDRQQVPKGGTVVWENLTSGELEVETKVDPESGAFEQRLPKDIFYGYYVDLEGYYSISQHLDLRRYKGDLVIQDSLILLPIDELIRDHIPVRINNLFFDFDKATIRPESHRELYRLVRFLLEHPGMQIEIAGHTDDWGDAPYNQDLSRRRASSVARFLVLSGCDPSGIVPKGYGETQPIAPNTTPPNRQLNRRVEFSILSQSKNN